HSRKWPRRSRLTYRPFLVLGRSPAFKIASCCATDPTTDQVAGAPALAQLTLAEAWGHARAGKWRDRLRPLDPVGAGLRCGRLKLGCAKDRNWLLFDPNELRRFVHPKGRIIKKREEKS